MESKVCINQQSKRAHYAMPMPINRIITFNFLIFFFSLVTHFALYRRRNDAKNVNIQLYPFRSERTRRDFLRLATVKILALKCTRCVSARYTIRESDRWKNSRSVVARVLCSASRQPAIMRTHNFHEGNEEKIAGLKENSSGSLLGMPHGSAAGICDSQSI